MIRLNWIKLCSPYELARGRGIIYNLVLSLLAQWFQAFLIPFKLAVDLISSGQRDSWPCWLWKSTLSSSPWTTVWQVTVRWSVPQEIVRVCGGFTIPCLTFKSTQYLAFLPSSLSFSLSSDFPFPCGTQPLSIPCLLVSQSFCLNKQIWCQDQHLCPVSGGLSIV